jgi:hypothetical protein
MTVAPLPPDVMESGPTESEHVDPTQLMVWSESQVAGALRDLKAGHWVEDEWAGSCLQGTEAGQRGVIYQTQAEQGLVGWPFANGRGWFRTSDLSRVKRAVKRLRGI